MHIHTHTHAKETRWKQQPICFFLNLLCGTFPLSAWGFLLVAHKHNHTHAHTHAKETRWKQQPICFSLNLLCGTFPLSAWGFLHITHTINLSHIYTYTCSYRYTRNTYTCTYQFKRTYSKKDPMKSTTDILFPESVHTHTHAHIDTHVTHTHAHINSNVRTQKKTRWKQQPICFFLNLVWNFSAECLRVFHHATHTHQHRHKNHTHRHTHTQTTKQRYTHTHTHTHVHMQKETRWKQQPICFFLNLLCGTFPLSAWGFLRITHTKKDKRQTHTLYVYVYACCVRQTRRVTSIESFISGKSQYSNLFQARGLQPLSWKNCW